MARRAAILIGIIFGACGCSLMVEEPPEAEPDITVPEVVGVSSDVPAAERVRLPRLARDSAARQAKRLTVRVRNISCDGIGRGSGFAVGRDVLVTNRHVLAGAEDLEVSTWDGRTLEASSAVVGVLRDIGVVEVDGRLPSVGEFGPPPEPGDAVTAVGYPLGGPLTLSEGTIVDRVDGADYLGVPGTVMRLTARVQKGNSGGPVLDRKGRIVGVVYALEVSTGFGLAIPVDTVRRLVEVGGFEDVPPCGAE
jgi:S1-C subfamily serine protease